MGSVPDSAAILDAASRVGRTLYSRRAALRSSCTVASGTSTHVHGVRGALHRGPTIGMRNWTAMSSATVA